MPLSDFWKLTRPGIVAMVLFVMTAAAWTAAAQPPAWPVLVNGLVGTAMVIVGAIALNQRLEARGDAKMARTAARPLPSGNLTKRQVAVFGAVASALGIAYLAALSSPAVVLLAALSWGLYVWTYTPLKTRSMWQTPVGALAGAMPVLIGAAVVDAATTPLALSLFGTVYFWQFPHSMAIAWRYREQFAAAEVKLPTVVDPTGLLAGRLAVAGAFVLLPISLVPWWLSLTGWTYGLAATVAGIVYLTPAIVFCARRNDITARWLLWASLVYLPVVFVAILVGRL